VPSKGGFILIKMSTTVTFVTPHCFGGRHDDSGIVNDQREGLVIMDGEERERRLRRRGERERGKGEKRARVCREYPLAKGRKDICKINGKKEEK
jgi:hypothetical protein